MTTTLPARSEIADKYKWNAPSVFADKAAWEAAAQDVARQTEAIAQYKGKLAAGPATLADFMDARDKLFRLGMKVYFYATMSVNCDSGDAEAQMIDEDFVEMLEYGMPPTTGYGMGERLFSFMVDKPMRQTVFFPQMGRRAKI